MPKTPLQADKNRLYCGDCRDVMRDMLDEGIKIDLIYLDPPFNSSRIYNMTFNNQGSQAQMKAFNDTWSFTHQTAQLVLDFGKMLDEQQDVSAISRSFLKAWLNILKEGTEADKSLLNYLMYMTERLILMKRLLKPTGSIYLHCDPTASHYIKVVMDGLFDRGNFRNEIIWHYQTGGASKRWFAKKHDVILLYSKDNDLCYFSYNKIMMPRTGEVLRRINSGVKGATRATTLEKLPMDVWTDIQALNPMAKERLGYPTQKPLALLDRIIKASCPESGIVFDPFCGCGTAIESAHINGVKWIGCDISIYAIEEIKARLTKLTLSSKNDYDLIQNHPETWEEYQAMNPYEKQDWLVRKVGGLPNPKKSGDKGIDGEVALYMGIDDEGKDTWGKMVFSVKTGKQVNPVMLRELRGTMAAAKANMGGLILDADPTPGMEVDARNAGRIEYFLNKDTPPVFFDKVQILTAQEIIEGTVFSMPHTMQQIKRFRGSQLHLYE